MDKNWNGELSWLLPSRLKLVVYKGPVDTKPEVPFAVDLSI